MTATDTAANAGTTAERMPARRRWRGLSLRRGRLARWMEAHVEGYAGPLTVEQFKGGQSKPDLKLVTPKRSYVLPVAAGAILKGAHAVRARGAGALRARADRLSGRARYGLCTDDNVIGSWFFVDGHVEGRIVWDAASPMSPATIAPPIRCPERDDRGAAPLEPDAIELGDYGRPEIISSARSRLGRSNIWRCRRRARSGHGPPGRMAARAHPPGERDAHRPRRFPPATT